MAKITARGCHEVAAHSTERTVTRSDRTTRYGERFVLRSDGAVLHRIRWSESSDYNGRLEHSSGYSIRGKVKNMSTFVLRSYLENRGYEIVDGKRTSKAVDPRHL